MLRNIKTHGHTPNFSYKVEGTRKSGDTFTSLFNSIINGLIHLYIYDESRPKYTLSQNLASIKMVVQGDDDTMVGADLHSVPFKKKMLRFGFKADCIKRKSLSHSEFCSSWYVEDSTGNCSFYPKPGRLLAKFGYATQRPTTVSKRSWLRGAAKGNLYTFPNDPIIQAIMHRVLSLIGYDGDAYVPKKLEHNMRGQITVDSEKMYFERYSLDPGTTRLIVKDIQTMQLGDTYSPLLQGYLLDRDTCGPQVIWGA